jgi:hypothetical protein
MLAPAWNACLNANSSLADLVFGPAPRLLSFTEPAVTLYLRREVLAASGAAFTVPREAERLRDPSAGVSGAKNGRGRDDDVLDGIGKFEGSGSGLRWPADTPPSGGDPQVACARRRRICTQR